MKIRQSMVAVFAAMSLVVAGTEVSIATPHDHSSVSLSDKKIQKSADEAISAYAAAVAEFVSAKEAATVNPSDKQLRKTLKRSTKQMKAAFKIAKAAISKEFHKSVRQAKKAYKGTVRTKKNQSPVSPEVQAAAQAVLNTAIATATALRDSQTNRLQELKPSKS